MNSQFENPTWRTAAILKIIISPYLSRRSSDFHKIEYAGTNFSLRDGNVTKNSEIRKFKMADGRLIENHFLAVTELQIVPDKMKFGVRRQNTRIRSRSQLGQMIKMPNYWRTLTFLKIVIPPYLSRESSNLTKFGTQTQLLTQPRKHQKHKSEINIKRTNIILKNYTKFKSNVQTC